MKIAPVADVKARFSNYLEQIAEGPVVITRNGRAVAVLVGVTDEEELERIILAHSPKFRRLLEEADRRIQETGGIKHKDFWKMIQRGT